MTEHGAPVAEAVVEEQPLRGVAGQRDRRRRASPRGDVTDQHRQLHRRQVLRLVDEQVGERLLHAAQELVRAQQDRHVVEVQRGGVVLRRAGRRCRSSPRMFWSSSASSSDRRRPFDAADAFGQVAVDGALAGLLLEPHRGPVHVGAPAARASSLARRLRRAASSPSPSRGSRAMNGGHPIGHEPRAPRRRRARPIGISARRAAARAARPRSVSRSAHSSTDRARGRACPRYAAQSALQLVQQRGVALDAGDGGDGVVDDGRRAARGSRRAARARPARRTSSPATPSTPSDGSSCADVRRQRRAVGDDHQPPRRELVGVGVGQVARAGAGRRSSCRCRRRPG